MFAAVAADPAPLLLTLTTLPHLAILFLSPPAWYSGLVICSTTLSVAWHATDFAVFALVDYAVAAAWIVADLSLSWGSSVFLPVAALNAVSFGLNQLVDWLARSRRVPYVIGHSLWHLANVGKALVVAWLLFGIPATAPLVP